jgi:hypothetical protein
LQASVVFTTRKIRQERRWRKKMFRIVVERSASQEQRAEIVETLAFVPGVVVLVNGEFIEVQNAKGVALEITEIFYSCRCLPGFRSVINMKAVR